MLEDGGGGLVTKPCLTLATPWTIAHHAPVSMGFPRQEYWSGLLFPSPGGVPNPGMEPASRISVSCFAGGLFTSQPPGTVRNLPQLSDDGSPQERWVLCFFFLRKTHSLLGCEFLFFNIYLATLNLVAAYRIF